MSFASPGWLLGLLPWAAVLLWLLMGRRERTEVPFIDLWRGTTRPPQIRPKVHMPPVATLCAIAAMLLAILGAARPRVQTGSSSDVAPPAAPPPAQSVTITLLSARAQPKAAVMVRVQNDSDQTTAQLKVAQKAQTIELPPRGQGKNYFVDLDQALPTIDVELLGHHGTLTSRQAWPILEPVGELPPEVRRMIDAYSKLRPPGEMSRHIVVTSGDPPADRPAVLVATSGRSASGTIRVEDHPVTAHVDWTKALADARCGSAPPGQNWRPVVSRDDRPAVAVREAPARQVWIGFTSETWPRSSDFVIFATNAFDWAGQGGDVYEAKLPLPPSMPAISLTPSNLSSAHFVELMSMMILLALALLGVSALLWTKTE